MVPSPGDAKVLQLPRVGLKAGDIRDGWVFRHCGSGDLERHQPEKHTIHLGQIGTTRRSERRAANSSFELVALLLFFIPINNRYFCSLLPLFMLMLQLRWYSAQTPCRQKGSLFGLAASNGHRRRSESVNGVYERAEGTPSRLRCAGCPGADVVPRGRRGTPAFRLWPFHVCVSPWNAFPTSQPLLVACNLPAAAGVIQRRTQCGAARRSAFRRHI